MQKNTSPDRPTPDAIPRWVKIFALVFASLLALFALLHLTGRGFEHGRGPIDTMERSQ
jgi:hypothetical protein